MGSKNQLTGKEKSEITVFKKCGKSNEGIERILNESYSVVKHLCDKKMLMGLANYMESKRKNIYICSSNDAKKFNFD